MTAGIRHIAILPVFITLFFAHFSPLSAQSMVGPAVSGGVVQPMDNLCSTRAKWSGGGDMGLAYEWQREHLLLRTGIHYSLSCPSMAVDSQWLEQRMLDTRGVPVMYRGLLDRRTDRITMHQLTVPLMVGGIWRGVYVLGGVRLAVALAAAAQQDAALRTVGDYEGRYYEWFENMPNHGYHEFEPVQTRHAMALNRIDLRLAAEIGYTFPLSLYVGRRPSPVLRVGLFAEYGLFNLRAGDSTEPAVSADWSQYLQVSMRHIFASRESKGSHAHLFFAGLRLTLLFPVSDAPSVSYPCRCALF